MPNPINHLAQLHRAVTIELIKRVESGQASHQELKVAIDFLKHNSTETSSTEQNRISIQPKPLPFNVNTTRSNE